jgi:hypothetical protein
MVFALLSYALSEVLFPRGNLWSTFTALPGATIVYALEIVLPLATIALLVSSRSEFGQENRSGTQASAAEAKGDSRPSVVDKE